VFSGDAHVEEVERNALELGAQTVGDEFDLDQQDDDDRGPRGKLRPGVDAGEGRGREPVLELGLVDDDEAPGLNVVGRGRQPGRFETGPDLLGVDRRRPRRIFWNAVTSAAARSSVMSVT
jgi:hypothetical protein